MINLERIKNLSKILLIELVVVGAVVSAYLAYDSDFIYTLMNSTVTFSAASSSCNINKESCSATMEDGSQLTIDITPKPIAVMKKLNFKIQADTIESKTLKLEIYGLNMNMGLFNFELVKDSNGIYRGSGMLPSCTESMQWRANVIESRLSGRQGVYFTFNTP